MEQVTVRVPATSANLASGFDCLGCALSLYDSFTVRPSDTLRISGCAPEYQNAENLVFQAYAAVRRALGQPAGGAEIHIEGSIPICRGLGSSSALLVGGAMAANALAGSPLSREALLDVCLPLEGHPDNLAPALFGGLTASMTCRGRAVSVSYPIHPALHFVALIPDFPLSTHEARGVLPESVPFADAVFNVSHTAVLLRALELGNMQLLAAALDDRLHQPYRWPLIRGSDALRAKAAELGCPCVCISGAGSTLLCLTDRADFAGQMQEAVRTMPDGWRACDLRADHRGAQVIL